MKTYSLLSAFFVTCSLFVFHGNLSGTDISGYINTDSTLTIEQSPYTLTGDLYIRNGATLTINDGVIINYASSSYEIFVGYSGTSTGRLIANNAIFNGFLSDSYDDQLYIRYGSEVSLTGCRLNNILLSINESSPILQNVIIENVSYAMEFINECSPIISNITLNNITNPGILFSGIVNQDWTMVNYGFPYYIISDVSVRDNATLTIAAGNNIRFNSNNGRLNIGYTASSRGHLLADNVDFQGYASGTSDYIEFREGTSSTLSNSTISDLNIRLSSASPTLQNLTIENNTYAIDFFNECSPIISNITLNNITNPGILFSGIVNQDWTMVNYGFPYYIISDVSVRDNATLTIAAGNNIRFNSNNGRLNIGYTASSRGHLLADNVDFQGYASGTSDYIEFREGTSSTLSNSTISDLNIRLSSASPTLQNLTIENNTYGIDFFNECSPDISNITFNNITYPGIGFSGILNTDWTMVNYGFPYYINSDVYVRSNSTLTIPPGNRLFFVSNSNELILGNSSSSLGYIRADSVLFASMDKYDDEIYFYYGSGGTITNSDLRTIKLYCDNSSPQISTCRIYRSQNAVYLRNNSNPVFTNNDFYNNDLAINNTGTAVPDGKNNFWGHFAGPDILTTPGLTGDRITGSFDYQPFLQSPYNGTIEPLPIDQNVAFSQVAVGEFEKRAIRITNNGIIDLKLTGASCDNPSFTVIESFPIWIEKGDTLTLTTMFAPHSKGIQQGKLTLHTNDYNQKGLDIAMSGEGIPVLSTSKELLEFGEVYLRDALTQELFIKNLSVNSIRVDSIVCDNSNYHFALTSKKKAYDETNIDELQMILADQAKGTSFYIYKGDSVSLSVTFRPSVRGIQDGALNIYYNGKGIEQVSLRGICVADPVRVDIHSVESDKYPFIYLNVMVDTFGTSIETLKASDFTIYENGDLQTRNIVITPPGESGGARLADIVFIMDNSGSMGDEQAQVRNNVINFVTQLNSSGVDYALGLCRYGQSESGGDPLIQDNGILSTDSEYFKNTVWSRNTTNGGTEPGYAAIKSSVNGFAFRPGAQKVFIIITDETPSQGSVKLEDAMNACLDNSVTLFALTHSGLFDLFTPITFPSNGEAFDITAPFDQILNYITEMVSSSYLVQYESNHPLDETALYKVRIEVAYNGNAASDTISFYPMKAPRISRTRATLALHTQSWGQGTAFNIEAEITDKVSPFVQSAKVYYRKTGSSSYQSATMSATTGNIYSVTLPASAAIEPGLDYYIEASDGQSTATDPTREAMQDPYQIAILPNEAPKIEHDTVKFCDENQAIVIEAIITDNTNRLESSNLFYRREGQLIYNNLEMIHTGNNQYSATIPAEFVGNSSIEYYLLAKDDFGIGNYIGWPDRPLLIEQVNNLESVIIVPDQSGVNEYVNRIMQFGQINKYFLIRDENGDLLPALQKADKIIWPVEADGTEIACRCRILGADSLVLSIVGKDIPLQPGQQVTLYPGDKLFIDEVPYVIKEVPLPFTLEMSRNPNTQSFDFYAGASLGAGALLGATGLVVVPSIAEISVSGSAGIGLNIVFDEEMNYTMARRMELSLASSVKIPSLTLPVNELIDIKMGVYGGIETKFLYGQSLYLANHENEDIIMLAKGGFILETATIAGYSIGPTIGLLLNAYQKTLSKYSNADEAVKQHLHEHYKGHGTDLKVGVGIGIDIPHKKDNNSKTNSISLIDISKGSSVLSRDITFPNDPSFYKYNYQLASVTNLSALSFQSDFLKKYLNLKGLDFNHLNMIDYSSYFRNNTLEKMEVILEGTVDITRLVVDQQIDYYKRKYILPQKAIMDIGNYLDPEESGAFLLSKEFYKPIKIGPNTFMNAMGNGLAVVAEHYMPGNEPIRVESYLSEGMGTTIPININLAAAIGVGFKLNFGIELSHFNSVEFPTKTEIILGDRSYLTEEFHSSEDFENIRLKIVIQDIINSGVFLTKEAILEMVDQFVKVLEKAGEFIVDVAEDTWQAIRITGKIYAEATKLVVNHYSPWTNIAFAKEFGGSYTKNTYISRGVKNSDGRKSGRDAILTIVSPVYDISLLDQHDQAMEAFDEPLRLAIPVNDSLLLARDFVPGDAKSLKLYRYNNDSIDWQEVISTVENDSVIGYIDRPGTYSLGIITSPGMDVTPPDITGILPSDNSFASAFPVIEATITDEAYGSGLDVSRFTITLNSDTLEALWAPMENRLYHAVADSLADGNYQIIISAFDKNGNRSVVNQNFNVKNDEDTTGVIPALERIRTFTVYPNPVADGKIFVRVDMSQSSDDLEINLYNGRGQIITNLFKDFVNEGVSDIPLELGPSITPGNYYIQLFDWHKNINVVRPVTVN